ncbi:MAG: PQQ-binding-like beta-propeller repeat protein, partial [Phycisphaerales bacterium]|nr:PQQ-binding-like beta-propeller repeat protein [Phycisphaerales bacterium]
MGDGLVALVTLDPQSLVDLLRVYDAGDGTLLWQRKYEEQAVDEVAVVGGWVITGVDGNRRVTVAESRTGRIRGRFVVPERMEGGVTLYQDDGMIYQGYRGVAKRNLPGGQIVWVSPADRRQTRMTMLDDRTLGLLPVGSQSAWLVDARHGKLMLDIPTDNQRRGFYDLAADPTGQSVHLLGFGETGELQLTVVDRESGRWQVTQLGQRDDADDPDVQGPPHCPGRWC